MAFLFGRIKKPASLLKKKEARYTPPPLGPPTPPRGNRLLAPTITDLTAILAILQSVDTAAILCNEIDNALEPEHEERQALKDLRKGLENLKSDIMVYEILLSPMEMDTPPSLGQQYVWGRAQARMLTQPIIHNITE